MASQLVATGHAEWTHSSQSSKCEQNGKLVTFRWEGGAREVGVAGTFSQWKTVTLEEK